MAGRDVGEVGPLRGGHARGLQHHRELRSAVRRKPPRLHLHLPFPCRGGSKRRFSPARETGSRSPAVGGVAEQLAAHAARSAAHGSGQSGLYSAQSPRGRGPIGGSWRRPWPAAGPADRAAGAIYRAGEPRALPPARPGGIRTLPHLLRNLAVAGRAAGVSVWVSLRTVVRRGMGWGRVRGRLVVVLGPSPCGLLV